MVDLDKYLPFFQTVLSNPVITLFILPVLAVVGAASFRYTRNIQQTSASDFILIFILFDASVLLNSAQIEKFIDSDLRPFISNFHLVSAAMGIILFSFTVSIVERKLSEYSYLRRLHVENLYVGERVSNRFPVISWLLAWIVSIILAEIHIIFFFN